MAITGERLDIKGIGQVLNEHFFRVPTYQRSYMWEKDNVSDYWHDIVNAMNADPPTDYFIGSIVLTATSDNVLEVVDGQQRLATTSIILAAIRDYCFEGDREPKRAEDIEARYLNSTNEDTLAYEPKLTLNEYDDSFFQEHVVQRSVAAKRVNAIDEKPPKKLRDSQRNIAVACSTVRTLLYGYVAGTRPADALARLKRIVKYVREQVKAILVTVATHDDAYTIFETLNDRGLDLSKADLLKNHLLRTAGKREREAQTKWTQMLTGLETVTKRDISVEFVRYLWISMYGHVRGKDLYKQIKAKVKEQDQAMELATDLAEAASDYASILNSNHTRWDSYGEDTQTDVANLIMLGIERIQPITLAIVRRFKKPAELKKSLYYLVAASVRLLIAGPAPGGQFEKSVADVAPKITDGTISTAKELAAAMNKEIVPNDADFQAKFAVASVSQTHLARYYLRALNASYDAADSFPARIAPSKSNVEHILPQNAVGVVAWSNIKDDNARTYCKRIGNLTLLRPKDNVAAGNGDFSTVKVPIYRGALSFPITTELASLTEWNETAIEERQKRFATLAVKIWSAKVK